MKYANAAVCGPGPHWVDTCWSGTDSFFSVASVDIDIDFDGLMDIPMVLSGPTTIIRGTPIDTPDPLDPGHYNQINTEIVDMYLKEGSFKLFAGDTIGNLANDGPLYSPGAVAELSVDPALASSLFDVFFHIVTPLGLLHNIDPLRVTAVIDRVPPIGIPYIYQGPPVPLFDIYDNPRAQLIHGMHIPAELCSIWRLPDEPMEPWWPTIPSDGWYTIRWVAHPEAVKYKLLYSINNGLTWNLIAYNVTGASYDWHVPTPLNNKPKCLVKIIGFNASGMMICEDTSDNFTIEVVKVTSLNGGEVLTPGSTSTITWRTNGTIRPVAKVELYYTTGGGIWNLITTRTVNTGSYPWYVPYVAKKKCKVKVVLKDASAVTVGKDTSDGKFMIGDDEEWVIKGDVDTDKDRVPDLNLLELKNNVRGVGLDLNKNGVIDDDEPRATDLEHFKNFKIEWVDGEFQITFNLQYDIKEIYRVKDIDGDGLTNGKGECRKIWPVKK